MDPKNPELTFFLWGGNSAIVSRVCAHSIVACHSREAQREVNLSGLTAETAAMNLKTTSDIPEFRWHMMAQKCKTEV